MFERGIQLIREGEFTRVLASVWKFKKEPPGRKYALPLLGKRCSPSLKKCTGRLCRQCNKESQVAVHLGQNRKKRILLWISKILLFVGYCKTKEKIQLLVCGGEGN